MRAWLAASAIAIALTACGGGDDAAPTTTWPDPPTDAIVKPTESGPVKATLAVWPPRPSLGDPLYVRLTVEGKAGVTLDVPFEHDALGRFRISGFDQRHEHAADGGPREIRNYALDALASGRHRIPPLRLTFTPAGATEPVELLTDEVPLEIEPVPATRVAAELRPAHGAIDPVLGEASPWPWILGGAGGVLAIGIAVFAVRRVRLRRAVVARATAYERAVLALGELARRGAPTEGDADAWFVELSAIVRRYLEDRFAVRAPELTTEEFLREAGRSPELADEQRAGLGEFLERCDRVKFAGWRPGADESLAILAVARAFVDQTRAIETHAEAA
ncbi:MAG: hypothetical protein K8W52_46680 [Deltaproteobacteria bacterium]|nr:hypothetical protein [Deltaproteobacteria bacterium]